MFAVLYPYKTQTEPYFGKQESYFTKMVDIHCHLIYGVDDGAASFDVSETMLADAARQGITDIIATPHYREGMFPYDVDTVLNNYYRVSETAERLGLRLFLGCEYHADYDMLGNLRNKRVATLAGSNYVLVEFSYSSSYINVHNKINELISEGYIPVIAHAERYGIFQKDPGLLMQFREMGAYVQLNADSILGTDGGTIRRTCKKILKEDLADIVASDSHDMKERRNRMYECRKLLEKKLGNANANRLFEKVPRMIIRSANEDY